MVWYPNLIGVLALFPGYEENLVYYVCCHEQRVGDREMDAGLEVHGDIVLYLVVIVVFHYLGIRMFLFLP